MLQKNRTYCVCPEFSLDRGVPKEKVPVKAQTLVLWVHSFTSPISVNFRPSSAIKMIELDIGERRWCRGIIFLIFWMESNGFFTPLRMVRMNE